MQSFADRVYFYELRHLLLYRRDDGWIYFVTTVGNASESGLLYPAESAEVRTPLAPEAPLAEAQAQALAKVQAHSRVAVTVKWRESTTWPDAWVGELIPESQQEASLGSRARE